MLIVKSITSCSTIRAIFGGTDGVFFYFILVLYILNGGVFNKRVIPLALVAYEMITANWTISYPTNARGILLIIHV